MKKKVRFEIEWEGKKRQEDVVVFLEDGLS